MVSDRSRGQLLLIGAIVIATVVIGSVVLLNSVHSSPSVTASTDATAFGNVEDADREIRSNLETVFLTTPHDEDNPLPYVFSDEFDDEVHAFENQYNQIIAADRSLVANISYLSADSQPGVVAYNRDALSDVDDNDNENASGTLIASDAGSDIEDGEPLFPVISLTAAGVDSGGNTGLVIEFNRSDSDTQDTLEITNDVELDFDDSLVDCAFPAENEDTDVSVDLTAGTGTITAGSIDSQTGEIDGETCAVDVGELDFYESYEDVTLEFQGDSGVETLSYAISAASDGATCSDDDQQGECEDGEEEDIDVNPSFEVKFTDPSVSHETSFTLYEEADS